MQRRLAPPSTSRSTRNPAVATWLIPLAAALALAGCSSAPRAQAPQANPAASAVAAPPQPPSVIPAATASADAPAAAAPSSPEEAAAAEQAGFAVWIAAFTQEALAAGIRPDTVQTALAGAQLQPRVIELDRAQPEFTRTPWAYLDSAVSTQRIAQGQAKRTEYALPLEAAAARYGVPASVVTAIWGMESNYGGNFGTFRAIDALATLGFEGRRAQWARNELMAALRILDQGDIAADRMIGSWAGAMGHTQFLPSVFLAYAIDADGDGRRDIWGSIPDVASSTANYLASSGWRSGQPWGVEVQLPPGFDHARAENTVRQTSAQWAGEGVVAIDRQPLPDLGAAYVIAPAGARGPAFLVGDNFRSILRYNNSVNYALAVGLLARQIEGGTGVVAAWPRDLQPLSRSQVKDLQMALNQRGFSAGMADGVMGPATRAGLRQFQQSIGVVADGYPTLELLQRLMAP
ncbi:lytic murein transglycosylase [Acidovorax sp. NCPPB 3576]|uniref:lytic murein transglycosylase n=1 Tax=Acidovorax sp. NCPPB 3576 TaxID=2940488 RepID=UPI00234B42D8|nr:lytic murein transglycosylase [Acidovorax sp. NCPPB 3576]WCM90196.1 lytic murein transglycosylase [Acidovorax sp. NCPPB 3576]